MAACVHVFVWVCECWLVVARAMFSFFSFVYFFKKDVVKTFAAFVGSYGSPV